MKTYIYLSDIHGNYEALKHLNSLPEMTDDTCEFRFGGDYSDGFDLQRNATFNTWMYIKNLCDSGKAKAILGNHDEFVVDAAYNPHKQSWWAYNGRESTLKNLGIPLATVDDLSEQLKTRYPEIMEWLKNLPLYIQDCKNLLVHAGFDLDIVLELQDRDTLLWTRDPYYKAEKYIEPEYLQDDFKDLTIISGHTPTISFLKNRSGYTPYEYCPIIKKSELVNRYFIDGGSKSGSKEGRINLLKLDENGNEIWKKYLTAEGIFEYGKDLEK